MRDPITVTLKFERPDREQVLAQAVCDMICSLPTTKRVQIVIEGLPDEMAATIETAFAIGRAQMAVKANRKNRS